MKGHPVLFFSVLHTSPLKQSAFFLVPSPCVFMSTHCRRRLSSSPYFCTTRSDARGHRNPATAEGGEGGNKGDYCTSSLALCVSSFDKGLHGDTYKKNEYNNSQSPWLFSCFLFPPMGGAI